MGFKPKARQTSNFETTTFPAGPTTFTLEKMLIRHFDSNFKPEGALKIMAFWKDGEGDEFTDFLTCPHEFAFNEKSAFWNRVAALAGLARALSEEDVDDFEISIAGIDEDSENAWEELMALVYDKNKKPYIGEGGKSISIELTAINYRGRNLIGSQCILNMKPKFDDKGGQLEGNKVAADGAMPLSAIGGGKKKSGAATPPPAATAPAASAAMP
ncbi:hypothetical protein [Deinococcus ruber]|uniref:Uncharacterized protein n=1 Tax=Deinococcus ruber TaxID=1848197 RepID=A0A918F4B6_9DEIO|nr:hypothetical protein [Deinococcus ruber]GGR00102.1 hypothetical protein GCM10008957_11010 [Deinococcus ruber]